MGMMLDVETAARAGTVTNEPTRDLEGKLGGTFGLTDILQMLSFSEKTGTLTLIQGWNTRAIGFEQGRIVFISGAQKMPTVTELLLQSGLLLTTVLDRVAAIVVKQGLVSPATLAGAPAGQAPGVALAATSWGNDELPRLLVEHSIVSAAVVSRAQEQQLEHAIYDLFLWRNCRFAFVGGPINRDEGLPLSLSAERLIIEGTRRVDEWAEISAVIPSVLTVFKRLPTIEMEPAGLSSDELGLLRLVDGVTDVATLARKTNSTEFDTAKRLYTLAGRDLVQAVQPNKIRAAEVFHDALETIYLQLTNYEHGKEAQEFERELNRFAVENKLKVRLESGVVHGNDSPHFPDAHALINCYKLFVKGMNHRFIRSLPATVVQGLVEALYVPLDPASRRLLRMYEFFEADKQSR